MYRYRAANSKTGVNPNLGGITALARRTDSPQQFGPVQWELLLQGTDYYLDRSGLWITLATKLDPNDYLAVSYRSAAGTTVGTFPEVDRGSSGGKALDTAPAGRTAAAGSRPAHLPLRDAADLPRGRRRSRCLHPHASA